jgi:hypothetical protein
MKKPVGYFLGTTGVGKTNAPNSGILLMMKMQ